MPEISVIIPTHNRAKLLELCLKSLLQQSLEPARYEICVINNGSSDNTPAVVAALAAAHPQHKLFCVEEPVLGLSRARNRGLASVSAPLVAFGDDDAMMPPDWLPRYLARFETLGPDLVKVGGEIAPIWGGPRPAWLTDTMLPLFSAASGMGNSGARFCAMHETILEGNSCYRRDALMSLDGFSTLLGRKGDKLLAGDGMIDLRLALKGKKFFFDPEIVIHHLIHADRLTPGWVRKRYFWQGVSNFAVRTYFKQCGLDLATEITLDLIFKPEDWAFVNREDTTENFDVVLNKLRSLGFVLASTGIIPVDAS